MRGRTKVISFAAVMVVAFVVSAVFGSGVVNVSTPSFLGPVTPDSPDSIVFVQPGTIIKDYINDPAYRIGGLFQVHVNITGAVDLFTYQVNVTYSPTVLNLTRVVQYGDLLSRTGSPYGTSKNTHILFVNRTTGTASISETILGNVAGITGNGRLFTIEFKILAYGYSWINIGTGGYLPTTLLESTTTPHAYTTTDGYFRNALTGDANLDKSINVLDILAVKSRWGRTPASPDWIREYDVNDDQAMNVLDILTVKANWGRSTP